MHLQHIEDVVVYDRMKLEETFQPNSSNLSLI